MTCRSRCRRLHTSASRLSPGSSGCHYGESSAAGATNLSEDFSHFGIRVPREAEREPRQVGYQLVVDLGIHFVLDDAHAASDLALEVLDPFLSEVSHVVSPEAMAEK